MATPRTTSTRLPAYVKPGPQFTATRADFPIIAKIAGRAVAMAAEAGVAYKHQDAMMDVEACHSNGCPLKLAELLAADDGSFGHDVFGIRRFLDRDTGKLTECFLPRFAQPAVAS
jgi:hypothetical protein